jgi:hypothetical protein
MIFILFLLVSLFNFFSCVPANNYLEGTTLVQLDYYDVETGEDKEVVNCFPNYRCNNTDKEICVEHLYKQVEEIMKNAVSEFKKSKDIGLIKSQFQYALCNVINIDGMLEEIKTSNYPRWEKLNKGGFIYHIRRTSLALSLLIKQAESLQK